MYCGIKLGDIERHTLDNTMPLINYRTHRHEKRRKQDEKERVLVVLCTRRNSNPYRRYRKPKFYPLNYGCMYRAANIGVFLKIRQQLFCSFYQLFQIPSLGADLQLL